MKAKKKKAAKTPSRMARHSRVNKPRTSDATREGKPGAADEMGERYKSLLEDQTEVISRFRADGTLTYVNEVYRRFFGRRREELIGRKWMPRALAEDLPVIQHELSRLSQRNPVVTIENRVINGEGEMRWMQFVNRAFFDKRGRLVETQSVGRDITERKLAEEALRESEARWRFAIESIGDGVWDWDMKTGRVIFSRQWKKMLGHKEEEIADDFDEWRVRVHPDDLPGAEAAVRAYVEGRTAAYSTEFRMRCKDGSWKWIHARGLATSRDGKGRPLRIIGRHTDISERKAAKQREDLNLRLVAEGAPREAVLDAIVRSVEAQHPGLLCCVMLMGPGGGHLLAGAAPSLPEYFRKGINGLAIRPDMASSGPTVCTGVRTIVEDIQTDKRWADLRKLTKRARLRSCWAEPVFGRTGQIIGTFACYHREVHSPSSSEIATVSASAHLVALAVEHEADEKALRDSEARFRRIVQTAEEGIITIDMRSLIDFVNPTMATMLGYTAEEMLGRSLENFMDEEGRASLAKYLKRRAKGISEQFEFKFQRKDGSDLWTWISSNPITDANGRHAGALAMVTDISSLKQAQADLMDREERYRGIMESELVGLVFWNLDGFITEANETFLQMVGYTRDDLAAGLVRWRDMTPAEYKQADDYAVGELFSRGFITPLEKEYFRKDGSRVPVIIGGALFPRKKNEGVSFVLDITVRKSAEKALRESEERYRLLADNTDDIVGLNDTLGNGLYVSPSFFRKTGWTADEVMHGDWRQRQHPDDTPVIERARAANLAGEATQIEHRVRCKDGAWLWFETHCKPLIDDTGKVWRLLVWSHDITQRKQTEDALLKSEDRYARAVQGTSDGLWDWNIQTGETYLSPRWKELLGFADAELPNSREKSFRARLHPDDVALVDAALKDHLEANKPYAVEARLKAKNGNYRWFTVRGEVGRDVNGQAVRMAGFLTDITERKKAEADYQRELEFNKALVRHTSALILVTDVRGRIEHANPVFTQVLGYELKNIKGRSAWDIGMMDEQEKQRSKERFMRLAVGEDNPPTEIRLRTTKGETRIVEIWGTSSRDHEGKVERVIVTGMDVTEKNQLRNEVLRIAEQEHARIGNDLHDGVGQTMTGIASLLEALEGNLEGQQKSLASRIRELVQESVAEVRRMSHGLSPAGVKNRGLGGGLKLLAETIRLNYRTSCDCEIDPEIKIGDAEIETHLFRIAQEAVNNAMRHGKPGLVTITLKRLNDHECTLNIEDNGSGFKKSKSSEGDGIGVRVMDYRATLIQGTLKIKARPRGGVTVFCRFPWGA